MGKSKFKFCVGTKEKRSSLFTVIQRGNDVYVTSESKKGEMKLSIHESGACQSSFTSEYVLNKAPNMKNVDRHLMKHELLPLSNRYEIISSYIFPYQQIVLENEILKQNVFWVNAPAEEMYVEIAFCKAATVDFNLDLSLYGWNVLKTIVLDSKELVLIMYRYRIMRELDYEVMSETEKKIKAFKTRKNITELVCATCGYLDDEKRRYEMEVFA